MIQTRRLKLQPWHDKHRAAFAQLHADPEVMADQGGPIGRTVSDAKFDRYNNIYLEPGVSGGRLRTPKASF